jgi:hypothetical protein
VGVLTPAKLATARAFYDAQARTVAEPALHSRTELAKGGLHHLVT